MNILKKFLSLMLVLTLLFTVQLPTFAQDTVTITLIHTNDVHARLLPDGYSGALGMAKIGGIVNQIRSEQDHVLLLDAGDILHGQTIATISEGESVIQTMNAMGYDGMVVGNHDFNYGQSRLLELADLAEFPILGANVLTDADEPLLDAYFTIEYEGITIGVFGLATPETTYKTHPNNVEGLTFKDPTETAMEMVEALEAAGVDIIICLGHIGEEGLYTAKGIIEAVDGIDIFVDGHSHTPYESGLVINDTLLVQTGEYGKNVGVVTLTYGSEGLTAEAMLIDGEMAEDYEVDADLEALLEAINEANEAITSVIIGETPIFLEGSREVVRVGQSNLGNLIANAILVETGADIAFTNGGGIRASIEAGDITMGDVITALPFGNYVVTKIITGDVLKAILENGISDYPASKGAFPHISGFSFTFDANREVGDKVVEILFEDAVVTDDDVFVLATNDFLAAGGDDYTMLTDLAILNEYSALDEVLIRFIDTYGTDTAVVDNRIGVVELVEPAPEPEPVPEPEPTPEPETPAAPTATYVVVSGDVLWRIAVKYGTNWEVLAEYNAMSNPHLIFPGDVIKIP